MANDKIQLLTENRAEQLFLMAIFLEERRRGLIEVSSFLLPDTAVSAAELYLLQRPERPIALILNAGHKAPEQIEKKRAVLRRILSKITRKNWHISLANPNVDAWVMADPDVKAEFEADPAAKDNRHEQAARIGDIAARRDLDREKIGESHPEFAALVEYIKVHSHRLESVV